MFVVKQPIKDKQLISQKDKPLKIKTLKLGYDLKFMIYREF